MPRGADHGDNEQVSDALARATALVEAEKAGWPNGFDRHAVVAEWLAILEILDAEWRRAPAELKKVLTRTYMKFINPPDAGSPAWRAELEKAAP